MEAVKEKRRLKKLILLMSKNGNMQIHICMIQKERHMQTKPNQTLEKSKKHVKNSSRT